MNVNGRRIAVLSLLLLAVSAREAFAADHPLLDRANARCSSCHADKIRGRSVHPAMALSCTVCHLVSSDANATTIGLTMPKAKICFGCHEEATEAEQHAPKVKGQCVDCHDSHSSSRRMLLRTRPRAQPRPSAF